MAGKVIELEAALKAITAHELKGQVARLDRAITRLREEADQYDAQADKLEGRKDYQEAAE